MNTIKLLLVILFSIAVYACGGSSSSTGSGSGNATLALFTGNLNGAGNTNGTGAAARFNYPSGVATDGTGDVYVADGNSTIRKITPAGAVTTLAGTAASFNGPSGVATDGAGNVYVADTYNYTIRKITPSGAVSTLAGTTGVTGSADGTGAAASFNRPTGVATDGAGNVYVADTGNYTIRKITPFGAVTTLAGTAGVCGSADSTGAAASFCSPQGVATDGAGNVYVADTGWSTIRKITPAGAVSTLAGTAGVNGSADGTGATASFNYPQGVATDGAGNLYVADGTNTIRKITPVGVVTTLAGTAGTFGSADGSGAAARFYNPQGIATDGAGNLYVADNANHTIRKITPAGAVSTLAGSAGIWGSSDGTGAAASFRNPEGVATDGAGNLYVADTSNSTIRKITPAGAVTTLAGSAGIWGSADGTGAAARFNNPMGVATDGAGNLYVADFNNFIIRKITPAGAVTTLAGTAGVYGSGYGSADGTGAAASFNHPQGVATDGAGNVYVADTGNYTIRKITPAGAVTTLAGTAGVVGSADGSGAAAKFNSPIGVATDGAGNLYVADNANNTIRKITPAGAVSTLAGTAGVVGSADGSGAAAKFNNPIGVATDGAGNVYVADTGNSTIRKITPAGAVTTVVGVARAGKFVPGALPSGLSFPAGVAISGTKLYITDNNGVAVVTNVP